MLAPCTGALFSYSIRHVFLIINRVHNIVNKFFCFCHLRSAFNWLWFLLFQFSRTGHSRSFPVLFSKRILMVIKDGTRMEASKFSFFGDSNLSQLPAVLPAKNRGCTTQKIKIANALDKALQRRKKSFQKDGVSNPQP